MRWTKIVALAAAGSLSLAACGGGSNKGGGSTGGDTSGGGSQTVALDATAKGPAPAVEGAKTGGTLTVPYNSVPETFDPTRDYYQDTDAIMSQLVTRSLTAYRVGKEGKPVLVPDLAEDLGTQSDDGLTWTFKLKPNLKYSDGSTIKAADFVYSIKRSFDTADYADGPAANYGFQYFKNFPDPSAEKQAAGIYTGPYTGNDKDFTTAEAPNDTTLVIHLKKKWPTFPYYAAFPVMSPIPQAKDTKANYGNNPVASGPYMFDSYTVGSELKLKKNPNWDPNSDPSRHQFVDAYDFKFGVDIVPNQTAIIASNGTAATSLNWDSVDSSLIGKVSGAGASNASQLVVGPDPCVTYATMDTRSIPLEVRKAYAVAYPIDQLRKATGETTLSFTPATTFGSANIPGFKAYEPVNGLTGKGNGDPAKAKQMLQAAGKTGFKISYYYANNDPTAVAANSVKKQALTAAGFTVQDVGVSKTDLRKKRNLTDGSVNTGQGPRGWCYDWPANDSVYPQIFTSAAIGASISVGMLKDPTLDSQINAIAVLPIDQQQAKWNDLDKEIAEKYLPAVPLDYGRANLLFGKQVHNVINDPNRGLPDLAQIWVG